MSEQNSFAEEGCEGMKPYRTDDVKGNVCIV